MWLRKGFCAGSGIELGRRAQKKRSLLKKLLNFLDYWIGSEQLSGFLVGEKSINVNWSLVFIHWGARCFFVFFSL